MKRRNQPHVVTGAARSRTEEIAARQRRYLWTMISRIVLLVVAALVAHYWSMWLGIVIGAISTVLPWIAVVMANEGPPRTVDKRKRVRPGPPERALANSATMTDDRRVISQASVIIDENGATIRPRAKEGTET